LFCNCLLHFLYNGCELSYLKFISPVVCECGVTLMPLLTRTHAIRKIKAQMVVREFKSRGGCGIEA
jgi:hypothetical protein